MDIEEIAIEHRDHITLMDNNILAAGDYALEQIEKIIKLRLRIDFNQALDARLVTPETAKLLAKVKWLRYIRFGYDTPAMVATETPSRPPTSNSKVSCPESPTCS